eukprot:CAMPEP_0206480046 /NCGR_PEP_ID=MMETSP0324_2-20121206/37020_1 /ASSEMBLY_ACC=CAM_ASM_000836 /TAXON_ID=2866 /ORGANISM="Crypthecodinium cohnii, Strain Seligo" /LENGTH=204 /DNA_ID=CAMNT_0053956677 /DNA_START=81 /DNA_END=692 /DNA_ORIENTATION=-
MSPFSSEAETQAFLPRIAASQGADGASGRRGQSHSSDRWQRMERIKANRHRGLSVQDDLRGEWADSECKLKWDRMRRDRSARRGDRGRPARFNQLCDDLPPQRPTRLPELASKPELTPIDRPTFSTANSGSADHVVADAPTIPIQFPWSFIDDEDDVDAPIAAAAPLSEPALPETAQSAEGTLAIVSVEVADNDQQQQQQHQQQ